MSADGIDHDGKWARFWDDARTLQSDRAYAQTALLPVEAAARKDTPLCTGCLDYFPLALAEVARVSFAGNQQHNPGQPIHWARAKSGDEADALARHLLERGGLDVDNQRHSAKLAWRALALLQKELEEELGLPPSRASR